MKNKLFLFGVLAFAPIAGASNQVFTFSGTQGPVSTTITNPYDGTVATLSGIYNVNKGTYIGTGTGNTLEMTNSTDLLTIDSADAGHLPNVQTVSDLYRIITGNGDDFVDMASANFTTPAGMTIFGGSGNETIWANLADTIIILGNGNNTVRGAAGNDTITTGAGSDTIDAGAGDNTVNSGGGADTLTYNVLNNAGATNLFNGGIGTDTLVLKLTAAEAVHDAADIANAQAFIAAHNDPTTDTGPAYTFSSFDLTFSNIESLDVQGGPAVVPAPMAAPAGVALIAGLGLWKLRRRQRSIMP